MTSMDTETATDPVCGMTVKIAGAKNTTRHAGHTHYFCSPRCLAKFTAGPERYLKPADAPAAKPVATGASWVGERWLSEDTLRLAEAAGTTGNLERVTPWAFPDPAAPPGEPHVGVRNHAEAVAPGRSGCQRSSRARDD